MGGGRKWFLPNTTPGSGRTAALDYVRPASVASAWGIPAGVIDPGRDLLSEFIADGFTYAPTATALNAIPSNTTKLLGLFNFSNMNVAKDKIDGRRNGGGTNVVDDFGFPDQPMLDEMTDKALAVLSQNPNGFVAMIEGGSIDKQAHLMDSDRWMIDAIEFDRAIERCRQFALAHPDTLVIVTADHECGGANIIGASRVTHTNLVARAATGGGTNQLRNGVVGTLDLAGFPKYTIAADGYPVTTDIDFRMLIGYACNADRYEDWITNPQADSERVAWHCHHAAAARLSARHVGPRHEWQLLRHRPDSRRHRHAHRVGHSAVGDGPQRRRVRRRDGQHRRVLQNDASGARRRRDSSGIDRPLRQSGSAAMNGVTPIGASLPLKGSPGGEYALQASTDLQTWTDLLTTPDLPGKFSLPRHTRLGIQPPLLPPSMAMRCGQKSLF